MFTICQEDGPDGVWAIFNRIRKSHPELKELDGLLEQGVTIAFMMRGGNWEQNGRCILGKCYLPRVQGDLAQLFAQMLEDTLGYFPDFLIILNEPWWEDVDELRREVLVFHECLHAGHMKDKYGAPRFNRQTGEPVVGLIPHDLEEFNAVVERYGAWKSDVRNFLDAAEVGRGREKGAHDAGRDENIPKRKRRVAS